MLTRWSDFDQTFAALDGFRRRMDRLFYDYDQLRRDAHWSGADSWPRMGLHDDGDKLLVFADVPGLGEEDIELTLNQNVLTIAGERKVAAPEGYATHRNERGSFKFTRSVSLPCPVDPEKAAASVKDGVLAVTLEKAPEAQPRQISVKSR